ncbi:hypothetical protein OUZ56_003207 [Daphnia magna]|uniref:Uncharacterized protein n=1 Tax=Daphnia magna TaxID=35525 RepID=A0ABR0A824_9CRUS|nr:hypothetical protein OUZ56_003207 [Daphnia magna]
MATKRLNQATLAVTIEVLEKKLHKDLKNYETAASENRLQEAETAFELVDDRMKRLIRNYETIIPMLEHAPEAQQKYLVQHEEFVDRFHKISIEGRKRNHMASPILQVAAPSGSNTPPSTTVTPPMNAMQLQVPSTPWNITHLLPRIEITKFDGDLSKCEDWWAIFRTLIHENPSMRPIEKFSRLKLHLTEDAAGAISVEHQEDFKGLWKLHDKAMGHALNLGSLDQQTAQNEAIMEILQENCQLN